MFDAYDYFILIAEELNISKAAQRAFVSQQSLSKYLQKLEEAYGCVLFKRKPKLELTPAGNIVLQYARQLQNIAANMRMELTEMSSMEAGQIVFGGSAGRVKELLRYVYPVFYNIYPNVELKIVTGMTADLISQVEAGNIDFLFAVCPPVGGRLQQIKFNEELLLLVISDDLMAKAFPEEFPECKLRFDRGVDLKEFTRLPFMRNVQRGVTDQSIHSYLKDKGIHLRMILSCDDIEIKLKMALEGMAVTVIPAMFLKLVQSLNAVNRLKHLNCYPLKDKISAHPVSLVYRQDRELPRYMKFFVSTVIEQYQKNYIVFTPSKEQS